LPDEQNISPAPSRKDEVSKTHEKKTGALEEPSYDVVFQPSAKASFGEWTELDTGSGTAVKALNLTRKSLLDVDEKAEFGEAVNSVLEEAAAKEVV